MSIYVFLEKSELFNKFFCEQSTLDDSDHTPPDITELQTDGLETRLLPSFGQYGIVPNDLVSLTFLLFYGVYSVDV
jgi:hypothetical protein